MNSAADFLAKERNREWEEVCKNDEIIETSKPILDSWTEAVNSDELQSLFT
jgi:hypothetical protein